MAEETPSGDYKQPASAPESTPETPPEDLTFTDEELDMIAKAIFSSDEGWVNHAAKFYSGRDQLEGYQKIALAPANAFEGLIRFGISIFDKQTYSQLATLVESVQDPDQRAILMNLLGKGWENCSTAEKTAFVLEIISTVLISVGALSKLKEVLPAAKLQALMRYATARQLAQLGQAVVASPADEIAAAVTPALLQIEQTKPPGES